MNNDLKCYQELVKKEDCVMVVIDMQERLMPAITGREALLQNTIRLLKFSKLFNIPIVTTEQEKLGSTLAEITKEAVGICPIKKVHFNSFMSKEFEYSIEQLKRKTLILAGVEAHICISQTAFHALKLYKTHVVSDAVGSRTRENLDIAIERMRQAGAIITSTEMVIYEIMQRAGTETFKSVLQLVK